MRDGCPNEETLSRYHDGELESAELTEHLAGCESCAATLRRFARLDALVTEASPPPSRSPRLRWAGGLALTAAGLVLGAGLLLKVPDNSTQRPRRYQLSAEGNDYVVSMEGDGYLVSMQIGDVVVNYEKEERLK